MLGLEMAHPAALPGVPRTILPQQATRCCCRHSSCVFSSAAGGTHQQLHRLLATHCDRAGDLLIPANGECAHGVACPPKHRLLPCQLLQHLHASKTQAEQGEPLCCRLSRQLRSPAAELPLRCWHFCCCSARPQSNDVVCVGEPLCKLLAGLLQSAGHMPSSPASFARQLGCAVCCGPCLRSLLQPVARLAHAAVENQLLHADLPHGVADLLFGLRTCKWSHVQHDRSGHCWGLRWLQMTAGTSSHRNRCTCAATMPCLGGNCRMPVSSR